VSNDPLAGYALGAGIAKGEQLKFTLDYASDVCGIRQELQVYKSDASKAGVDINLDGQTSNTVIGTATPCSRGPSCTWDASTVGGWVYGPDYEPTGEELFGFSRPADRGCGRPPSRSRPQPGMVSRQPCR